MFAISFMEISAPAVEQLLDASAASFRAFYEQALPRVYGYFLHRCGGSVPMAEDLTQETFLAAVAELKKGRRVEAPIAWVHGITRHKLLDYYRRQERAGRPLVLAWEAEQMEQELVVADDTEARERAIGALAAVAATQRAALVLCYLDGTRKRARFSRALCLIFGEPVALSSTSPGRHLVDSPLCLLGGASSYLRSVL